MAPETVSPKDLEQGPFVDDKRTDALVALLKTLAGFRHETLLRAGD